MRQQGGAEETAIHSERDPNKDSPWLHKIYK